MQGRSIDSLAVMFDELLDQLPPPLADTDHTTEWLRACTVLVQGMAPLRARACTLLLAEALVTRRYPGLPVDLVYAWLIGQFGLPATLTIEEGMR